MATQASSGFGGRLSIASTTITGGTNVTRSDNDSGSYACDPDCTGGTIYLNLSGLPIQWLFTIVPGGSFGTTLTLRATGVPSLAVPFPAPPVVPGPPPAPQYLTAMVGTAWPAPTACPVANPLNVLSGTVPFTLSGGVGAGTLLIGPQNLLVPFWLDPQGTLIATVTVPSLVPGPPATDGIRQLPPTAPGPPYPRNGDTGTFTVASDCARATFYIYFEQPRPFFYDGYARRNTAGVISYSVISFGPAGTVGSRDFVASTGTIN